MIIGFGSEMSTESVITQPLSFVIVTEYNPVDKLLILSDVLPFDQR